MKSWPRIEERLLQRSGGMALHGDEGRMTAEEIAEAINKNPNYGWHYLPLTADQVSEALMEVVRTDKRFAWFRSFYPEQINSGHTVMIDESR